MEDMDDRCAKKGNQALTDLDKQLLKLKKE